MKYSFMSFSCPKATFPEMLDVAAKNGYDGVEIRMVSNHSHEIEIGCTDEHIATVKQSVKTTEIEISCLSTSCTFANSNTSAEHIEFLKKASILAAKLNIPVIRVFGGALPKEVDREQATKNVCKALLNISDNISADNVKICLETHDSWRNPEHVAAVMTKVNRPNICVNWDIMHPILNGGFIMEQTFEILKPWIAHVHIHDGATVDGKMVMKPIGTGEIDHKTAIKCLKEANYSGFISGEWINWEYPEYLREELRTLRKIEEWV